MSSFKFLDKNTVPLKDCLLISYFLVLLIEEEGISFYVKDGVYFDIENSVISEDKTLYKLTKLEKEMICNLFSKKIDEIVELSPTIDQIKKVILLLETYINYHLNLKINFKRFF